MKPVRDEVRMEGNLVAIQDVKVTLDEQASPHLMAMFTDLYTDRRWAVVREYLANALDSHRAAKQTQPVEVFTPSPLGESVFSVRDYGVGLNKQDIIEVISKYGASTKRETDDQAGCLGLGCKSALTYSPQFTYIGIKNGIKTVVITQRDDTDGVVMKVMSETETDEPNGVEVQVPVKPEDSNYFEQKAREMMGYWPKGSAVLNGKPVEQTPREFELTPDIYLRKTGAKDGYYRQRYNYADAMIIVMGNVPYPIDAKIVTYVMEGKRWTIPMDMQLIAHIDMGQVHFQPSREGLRDTKLTKDTIKMVLDTYETHVAREMQAQMDTCTTHHEAIAKYHELINQFRGFPLPTYKGEKVPDYFEFEGNLWSLHRMSYYLTEGYNEAPQLASRYRSNNEKCQATWDYSYNGVYVEGFDISKWNRRHLEKLLGILRQRGIIDEDWAKTKEKLTPKPLLIFEKMPDEVKKWVDPKWIVHYDQMREYKLPTSGSGGSRESVTDLYHNHAQGTYTTAQLQEFYQKGKLYYGESRRVRRLSDYSTIIIDERQGGRYNVSARLLYQVLTALYNDAILICVPSNRLKKFERLFPNAKEIKQSLHSEYEDRVKKAGPRVRARMALSEVTGTSLVSSLQRYKKGKIDDPELRKLGVLLNDEQLTRKSDELRKILGAFANLGYSLPKHPESVRKFNEVYERYPLFHALTSSFRTKDVDEILLYVNAAYAARKE